jgi:hypothetical protein
MPAKRTSLWLFFLFAVACTAQRPMIAPKSPLDEFIGYLVGDFDNQAQVAAETQAGTPEHPYAKHVTRVIDERVKNRPAGHRSVFVLEESYYKYPNKDTLIKPYLFRFEQTPDGQVRLHSLTIPARIDKNTFRNANPAWQLDYAELTESDTFKPATYSKTERGFYLKAPNDLPGGMRFTLEETIGNDFLDVMELLEKEGKSLTPYRTPLLYKRVVNGER